MALEVFHAAKSVPVHRHDFQEFVLITKGSCIHQFKNISMPLIPGDVFLIPPHQEHAYVIETPVCMYNCQFYPEQIADWWDKQFSGLLSELTEPETTNPVSPADLNRQHIIHLSAPDAERVQMMMDIILHEQTEQNFAFEQVKQDYLNLILIIISRARLRQFAALPERETLRPDIIAGAQKFIEDNLKENIDFSHYARLHNISPGYFRTIFKSATGLPPVEYLNRLRIVRAIEYLKDETLSISDVSAAVGIYDLNYFSRLFRKIIGYSPREFRTQAYKVT
ncbi:AraC family transcriptional regulator [Domibacillus sp. DTU_2020_1001157_1_SI_ALB_TIR_016]|uniref:AraC family transcriptional regulator n=1 Tax=Domibacillus sp. DTU_2020_1001157_1_SI_ALB_TIR_016 TaxID=3077789 RepID=UPI0028E1CFF0|nr:AraC family transcriptional regulator [Domibacillus sp. DTU_2020_1001157_1_SI_ALB_TIR_016]WNS79114.1 AraC family transcriptional regulator [Domibacillus sp. DTU_2020_1001157_1_SI_ALB_TIR_016]